MAPLMNKQSALAALAIFALANSASAANCMQQQHPQHQVQHQVQQQQQQKQQQQQQRPHRRSSDGLFSPRFRQSVFQPDATIAQAANAADAFFGTLFNELGQPLVARHQQPQHMPPYEMFKSPNAYTISLDLPGCSMDDVMVMLEEGGEVLRIEGRRPARGLKPEGPLLRWRFEVSRDVDTSLISARMSHGTLSVELPLVAKAKAQKIHISPDDDDQQQQQQQQHASTQHSSALPAGQEEQPQRDDDQQQQQQQQLEEASAPQQQQQQHNKQYETAEPDVIVEEEVSEAAAADLAPSAASIDNTHISIL
ncbi:hypothetical protein JKP88DRAFT_352652 [Tribonema minus]|uniref:SHSP domain-containing protein n=1 Tax=Tribonema minus TaxID=303371 RepID=A0A835ZBG3_9STRA|nr:hypothetical protein JKP88DRAFT_352652 [Tribonema minus]